MSKMVNECMEILILLNFRQLGYKRILGTFCRKKHLQSLQSGYKYKIINIPIYKLCKSKIEFYGITVVKAVAYHLLKTITIL